MPTLVLALCEDEKVESVTLREASLDGNVYEVGERLWSIEAQTPSKLHYFVVGVLPDGFTETSPPPRRLPSQLVLEAEVSGATAAAHGGFFELGRLGAGKLISEGGEVEQEDLERAARANCSSNPLDIVGISGQALAVLGSTAGLIITAAVLLARRQARRWRSDG